MENKKILFIFLIVFPLLIIYAGCSCTCQTASMPRLATEAPLESSMAAAPPPPPAPPLSVQPAVAPEANSTPTPEDREAESPMGDQKGAQGEAGALPDEKKNVARKPASEAPPQYVSEWPEAVRPARSRDKAYRMATNNILMKERKKTVDQLPPGGISANIPSSMVEHNSYVVTAALLSYDVHDKFSNISSKLVESMPSSGESKVWPIDKVGSTMVLTLHPVIKSDFEVTPISPQDDEGNPKNNNEISAGVPAIWTWTVTPLRASSQKQPMKLLLTATAFYTDVNGKLCPYPLRTQTYEIVVKVNPAYHLKKILAWIGGITIAALGVVLKNKITDILRKILKVNNS
jgi:hypothetical protein